MFTDAFDKSAGGKTLLETFDFGLDFLGLDLTAGPEVNKQNTIAFRPFFWGRI